MSWVDFVAGCGAGMVGIVVGQPLDTVRIHQQTKGGKMLQACHSIYRRGGIHGFFRGMAVPLFANGIISGIFFASFEYTVELLLTWKDHDSVSNREDFMTEEICLKNTCEIIQIPKKETYVNTFIAGCVGGLCQSFVVSPVELVKIQLQTDNRIPNNSACIKLIHAGKGLAGFAVGLKATLARDIYANGVFMSVYKFCFDEWSKKAKHGGFDGSHPVYPLCAGGAAGIAYWTANMPFDVIKSKMQAQDLTKPCIYKGILHCAGIMYRSEGLKSFYPGYFATILRGFPVNGCTLLAYDWIKLLIGKLLRLF